MSTPKPSVALTINDIRHLFETSPDANVVRDCARVIGAGFAGVLERQIEKSQREILIDRLAGALSASRVPRVVAKHRGFAIVCVTFHQPYCLDGMSVRSGYNLCSEDGYINVAPGACWFMTIVEAMRGIDCLIEAGGLARHPYQEDEGVGDRFWKLMEKRCARTS